MSQLYIYTDYVHPYYARKMLNLNIVVPGNVIWKSFSVYTIFFGLNVASNAFPRTLLLLYNFYYFATGGDRFQARNSLGEVVVVSVFSILANNDYVTFQ